MSVYGYYAIERAGLGPEALLRALCAEHHVTHVALQFTPRTLDDIAALRDGLGLDDGFTQVTCVAPITDPVADLRARLGTLPRLDAPRAALDALNLRYEETEATLAVWKALGSKRRTEVTAVRAVGVDLRRPAVAFGVGLDYSMVRGVRDDESRAVQGWWRGAHHAFLDERLRRLGVTARFDLDVNKPAVLASSSERVSVTTSWGHLSYPIVLVETPAAELVAAATAALEGTHPTRVVTTWQGPARELSAVRPWLTDVESIWGPSPVDPRPLDAFAMPAGYTGAAVVSADLPRGCGGDLMLSLDESPRLEFSARGGLTPAQQARIEKRLGVTLTFVDAG